MFKKENKLWIKAKKIIPGGSMLYSKRAENFLPGIWPAYYKSAKGCYIWTLDNKKLVGILTNRDIRFEENLTLKVKDRMTSSRKLFLRSKVAIVLFFGELKREAFKRFQNIKLDINDCPAKVVNFINESYILTDL